MDVKAARLAISRRLRFGDEKQIAAYDHLERVAELEELLDYLLEGDDTEAHATALRDAIENCDWHERLKQIQQPRADEDVARAGGY